MTPGVRRSRLVHTHAHTLTHSHTHTHKHKHIPIWPLALEEAGH
jgi:hypothetical protein